MYNFERRHTISSVTTAKLTLIAVFAAWWSSAQAQSEPGWYLGTGLIPPMPRAESTVPPHPSELRESTEPSYQQFGGYRFTRHWSVDFGYGAGSQSNAWTLSGSGLLPIGRSFSLQGRLGLAVPTAELSLSSAAGALSTLSSMDAARYRTSMLWGLGGQFEFTRNVGLRMDFNSRYNEDAAYNRARSELWSINAVVRF